MQYQDIEVRMLAPIWYTADENGLPTWLTSDAIDLTEWAADQGIAESYFCACGHQTSDWSDVVEHLAAPVPAEVLALVQA